MACIITYENKQYTQKEFEQYFKEHFTEFVDNFLGSKQDIDSFKKFVEQPINKEIKPKIDSSKKIENLKRGDIINFQQQEFLVERVKNEGIDVRDVNTGDVDFISIEDYIDETQEQSIVEENVTNNQKTEDYFNEEIKKIQKESKTIDEKISKFESTQKIDNKNTSKALQNMQEKVKIIGDKLLSLGFESINEKEHDFKTSSYITFKSKLKELENLDIDINTFKSPDYLIKTKIKSFKNNFNSQKQGELPFNPIELKIALSENEFIKDIADNTFEGLTDEQIKILKENLDKGEFNLNCKI